MNLKNIFNLYHGDPIDVELCLAGILAQGHLLIEGPPGVGKTLLSTLMSRLFSLECKRVQGTPDLMPADILGTHILQTGNMVFRKGPVFCDILLVDEINRITPKTFSALLQVMEEKEVSLRGETFPLSEQFHVLATRSNRENEGVYKIPEAALDRFIMSLRIGLPDVQDEKKISLLKNDEPLGEIAFEGSLKVHQQAAEKLPYSEKLLKRITDITRLSREDNSLFLGAGVRASQALLTAARALSYIRDEPALSLSSLKAVVLPVLSHRLKPYIYEQGLSQHVEGYMRATDPVEQLRSRFSEVLQ